LLVLFDYNVLAGGHRDPPLQRLPLDGEAVERSETDEVNKLVSTSSVKTYGFATCLAAARSRRGSDTTLWCHSTPRRRFATHQGEGL
jgi:hypothetical protein